MRYIKNPIVVTATQWFKNVDHPMDESFVDEFQAILNETSFNHSANMEREGKIVRYFRKPDVHAMTRCNKCDHYMHHHGFIDTLEGGHIVCPGDWIITGVNGEYYPCKPDIFKKTYTKIQGSGDSR